MLNLSRCPGPRDDKKKAVKKKLVDLDEVSASLAKNAESLGSRSRRSNVTLARAKKRRRESQFPTIPNPIHSFRNNEASSELRKMQREFFGEDISADEGELSYSKDKKTPPIPKFNWESNNFYASDASDDDDLFSVPIFNTKKKKPPEEARATSEKILDEEISSKATRGTNSKDIEKPEETSTETTIEPHDDAEETMKSINDDASFEKFCGSKAPSENSYQTTMFHEIDSLYRQSDKENVTLKSFYKLLEKKMGKKLSKESKQKVRARLGELVNGGDSKITAENEMIATETTATNSLPTIDKSKRQSMENEKPTALQVERMSTADAESEKLPSETSKKHNLSRVTEQSKLSRDESSPRSQVERTKSAGLKDEKLLAETTRKQNRSLATKRAKQSTTEKEKEPPLQADTTSTAATESKKPPSKTTKKQNRSRATNKAKPSTVAKEMPPSLQADRALIKSKHETKSKQQAATKDLDSDCCIQTVIEPPKDQSTTATQSEGSPRKRTRRFVSKSESSAGLPKTKEVERPAQQSRSRKRIRKGTCALCTTCSCQKLKVDESGATLDLKTFSRSDAAIEKALIRRLKKIEKSAENLEEQTEMVRRKLKKHRREIFRKKKKSKPQEEERAYFLPDAEEFESQQDQSRKISNDWVLQAQQRMFPVVPNHQQTLTQLGFPSSKAGCQKPESPEERSVPQVLKESKQMDVSILMENMNSEENNDGDSIEPLEQSIILPTENHKQEPGAIVDKIHRFRWANGEKSDSHDGEIAQSQSLWGALRTIGEEEEEEEEDICPSSQAVSTTQCSWDRLFTEKTQRNKVEDEGIDQLFDLFNGASTQTETSDADQVETSLSMLSQGGQERAASIFSDIDSDESKVDALNRVCPNWKENIAFAFLQDDTGDISNALESLRNSRSKMMKTKQKILEAWGRHQAALDVLETALGSSLDRLKSKEYGAPVTEARMDSGFMTQHSEKKAADLSP